MSGGFQSTGAFFSSILVSRGPVPISPRLGRLGTGRWTVLWTLDFSGLFFSFSPFQVLRAIASTLPGVERLQWDGEDADECVQQLPWGGAELDPTGFFAPAKFAAVLLNAPAQPGSPQRRVFTAPGAAPIEEDEWRLLAPELEPWRLQP